MKIAFFILLSICSVIKISAQSDDEHFRFILTMGAAGTQVDGDSYGGYNKIGPVVGIHANRKMGEKTEFSIGLSYIQMDLYLQQSNQ